MSVQHRADSINAGNAAEQALEVKIKLLEAQIKATGDRQDFDEDCIAEIAEILYA